MFKCEECSKKLGILRGYRHPALGKKYLLCVDCFDKINRDMERWSKFCHSDSFDAESSNIEIQDAWNKKISDNLQLQKWFRNLWIKIASPVLVE